MSFEGLRDVLTIILFLETIIVIVLLIILILQIFRLVRIIRGEVVPILQALQRTANTVQGTAEFVGETTVVPIVRVASALSATRRFVAALLRLSRQR